jgi:hypothetical protein
MRSEMIDNYRQKEIKYQAGWVHWAGWKLLSSDAPAILAVLILFLIAVSLS